MSGPFYLAWVNPDQTTFDESTMLRFDEDVFSAIIKHDEGQVATMALTIKNPRVGLLNAGRKLWAWLAYRRADNAHVQPLFFGVLVSVPDNLIQELVTIHFNARPHDFIARKQTVAETLKIRPYWDPVFLDEQHRDDPDAVLEGWSKLYHIDRVTHEITVSDILDGEDGTTVFEQADVLQDSVQIELGEAPLDAVEVVCDVKWTQRFIGYVPGPSVNVTSYTGGSFKGDWPKPGADIGGGWKVEQSYVVDIFGTEHATARSTSGSSDNKDPSAEDCSTDSISVSITSCSVPGVSIDGTFGGQTGICNPDGENADGSVGINIPCKVNSTGTKALLWQLNCQWNLRYDAKRDFTETATILVQANVQETVTSPTVEQNSESIKMSGADVGLPLIQPSAWSNFVGRPVAISQIIFPNTRSTPGGTAFQICVQAGTAGTVEPIFSNIPGTQTIDGTVIWSSLGDSAPDQAPQWSDSSPIPLGEIVLYEPKEFNDFAGAFEPTGQSCFLIALQGGTTNSAWHDFTYLPGITSNDDTLPLPVTTAYFDGPGQSSPYSAPVFAEGTLIDDGTVVWMSLGESPSYMSIPIGGTIENVPARSYLTSDRGLWSIEHAIAKARARLRLRSRCIKLKWRAPFEMCIDLSCRKKATIFDPHIPGGQATGKITSYTLTADKDGLFIGDVEIGVPVGFGGTVEPVDGTPDYALAGYMQPGYQHYTGGSNTVSGEISYEPPIFKPFDDGLSFPLQSFPGRIVLTTPSQITSVEAALARAKQSPLNAGKTPVTRSQNNKNLDGGTESQFNIAQGVFMGGYLDGINPVEYALEANPVAAEIIIHPVTNGPFNASYVITCSLLEIPQGIDLGAPSSP